MKKAVHLAGVGYAVIFGFTFLFSKTALLYVSPIGLISYRFLVAFLAFEGLRLFKVVKIRFLRGAWRLWLPAALCEPILYFLFESFGLSQATSGEAGMMLAMIPIFVALLSMLVLRERPRPIQIFFILLSVAGILLIQFLAPGSGDGGRIVGFLLLFAAVLAAAFFNIASKKALATLTPFEITYFMMMSAAIAFNAIYLVQLAFGDGLSGYVTALFHPELAAPILYLGIVASIGGFFLVNVALSKLPPHVSSIYSNLSTVVAIAAGAVFLDESIRYYHLIGSAMILVGVYGTIRSQGLARSGSDPAASSPLSPGEKNLL
ncbi:MAG: DMT family transporter [Candidatus Izemoplasmatales bacterium]